MRFGTEPLGRFAATRRLGLRWKVSGAIFLILAIFFAVTLFSLAELQYTHSEVHRIITVAGIRPPEVTAAIEAADSPGGQLLRKIDARRAEIIDALGSLERTQHRTLFWTPVIVAIGGVAALAFGIALSGSLVPPIQKMSDATRRISQGDFSRPVEVQNKDELGDLATRINLAARDLSRLQDALVAQERAKALRERVAHVTRAQEDERRRLSRELHDGLGPSLAAVSNRLSECRQMFRNDPSGADAVLEETTNLLRSYVGHIRTLSHDLRPPDLEQLGLVEALRLYVERFGQETDVRTSFEASGVPPADSLAEITVYQVVQESLMNVRKHANASKVDVGVKSSQSGIEVTVADDGRGFELSAARTGDGVGLTSMHERAELMGGELRIDSHPGAGCRVTLEIQAGV